MAIRLTRPSDRRLDRLRDAGRSAPLTYDTVGMSLAGDAPDGFRTGRWSVALGAGDDVVTRAVDALDRWLVHTGAGLAVRADGPPAVGAVVALAAPLPLGHVEAVCRVVAVVAEADRWGFAYGTLPTHPETGEESFLVRRVGQEVVFEITACWRARHPLARLVPPLTRTLQRAATDRYLEAMRVAVH